MIMDKKLNSTRR